MRRTEDETADLETRRIAAARIWARGYAKHLSGAPGLAPEAVEAETEADIEAEGEECKMEESA